MMASLSCFLPDDKRKGKRGKMADRMMGKPKPFLPFFLSVVRWVHDFLQNLVRRTDGLASGGSVEGYLVTSHHQHLFFSFAPMAVGTGERREVRGFLGR